MNLPKKINTDIVIVGAGLVGMSMALCMSNAVPGIHILEKQLPAAEKIPDSRPISLSYGSYRILHALGVWDALEAVACPILSVHVSEQGKFGVTHFSASQEKVPALGFVVPFSSLHAALHNRLTHANIVLHHIETIHTLQCDATGAHIVTDHNDIHADLLIATDGTHSTCRDLLHISTNEKNSGDTAHIYQLQLSADHTHTAYERFTPWGVLAVLPLFEKRRAQMVWTLTPRLLKKIQQWDETKILAFLQDTFEGRLSIQDVKKSAQFPLQTVIAKKQIHESAVLLGNAAHTLYPVAAQGFNLGLHDAAILSDFLLSAVRQKKSMRDFSLLKQYESAVASHQAKIFKLTGHLMSLFELPLISAVRGLGLSAIDVLQPCKNRLAKRTMGIADKMPRVVRDHR